MKKYNENFVILSLYVDDILLARNNLGYVKTVKSWLNKSFHMKDLGEIDYILGVNIQTTRFEKFWSLSQETDTQKILKRFRMYYYKPMDNPIARGKILSLEICP